MPNKINVLFVCMGNICRSPTAEAVFSNLLKEEGYSQYVHVDSAGTHAYHIGEQPDDRSQSTALKKGIDMSNQRSRVVTSSDFEYFDYILAMDRDNYSNLQKIAANNYLEKIHLFLNFSKEWAEKDVPDPYYGGTHGFDRVFDMVESASRGLLEHLLKTNKRAFTQP